MKVLVTGGAGFIGQHLISALLARGHDVTSFGFISSGWKMPCPHISGDVTDCSIIQDAFNSSRPEVVVHLAGHTGVAASVREPGEAIRSNLLGTFNVALCGSVSDVKVVFASSREVYGEKGSGLANENSRLQPVNEYGLSKKLAEEAIMWFSRARRLRFCILRLTNVYGPGGDSYVVQKLVKRALNNQSIALLGGSQLMNFVYVKDVVNAFIAAIESKSAENQIFNVGSQETLTVRRLVRNILKETNREGLEIIEEEPPPAIVFNFRPDISKIERVLGWKPRTTMKDGLKSVVQSCMTQPRE